MCQQFQVLHPKVSVKLKLSKTASNSQTSVFQTPQLGQGSCFMRRLFRRPLAKYALVFVILLTIDAKRRLETREVNLKNMRQFIGDVFYQNTFNNHFLLPFSCEIFPRLFRWTPACYEKHLTLIGLDATN